MAEVAPLQLPPITLPAPSQAQPPPPPLMAGQPPPPIVTETGGCVVASPLTLVPPTVTPAALHLPMQAVVATANEPRHPVVPLPSPSVVNGAKRPRLDSSTAALLQQAGTSSEDDAWTDQWGNVFGVMHEGCMEARANEYAEVVVSIKMHLESLLMQRATLQASCEQLRHTAYREALQAHVQGLVVSASAGMTQDLVDSARHAVDELSPSNLLWPSEPAWKARQPLIAKLGIGVPQPGVEVVPGPAVGVAGLPPKPMPAVRAEEPSVSPHSTGQFSQIGQFAAAAAAAQQEAAAAKPDVLVSGLPEGIDGNMFKMLFSRYGSIVIIKLMNDKRSGHVRYKTKEEAQAAIAALNGFECNGVKLSVQHTTIAA